MALTPAQVTVFAAHIQANTDPNIIAWRQAGETGQIANWYNQLTSPAIIGWKTKVTLAQVGETFVATGLAALTSANNERLRTFAMYNPSGVSPSRVDHRTFFDEVFSVAAGASTRAALLALWKRTITRGEQVFMTGVGSDVSPATLTFEGVITNEDVVAALFGISQVR